MIGEETKMMIRIKEFIKHETDLVESFIHIANERKTSFIQGKILKKMGVMPDVSDIFITRPFFYNLIGYLGCWIEVKAPGKKPNDGQLKFLENRRNEGYFAFWSDDEEFIKDQIKQFYPFS